MLKKTKAMVFGRKNCVKKYNNIKICAGNDELQFVNTFKYLGVTLDCTLSYNQHINLSIRNTCHKLYQLKRVNQYLTPKTSLMIYKSFILPIIEYGNIMYHKSCKNQLKKLQRIQNQALKLCLGLDKRTSTNLIHKLANINYLEDRREKALLNFMFSRTKIPKFNSVTNYTIERRSTTAPKLHTHPNLEIIQPKNQFVIWAQIYGTI